MRNKSKTSIQNHPALLSDILKKHLDGFKSELLDKGYTKFYSWRLLWFSNTLLYLD
jgi:hypothetical protein